MNSRKSGRNALTLPALRHWLSGTALFGAGMAAFNVIAAVIQIAPQWDDPLIIGLMLAGWVLSVGAWYSLALANANAEQQAAELSALQSQLAAVADDQQRLDAATRAGFQQVVSALPPKAIRIAAVGSERGGDRFGIHVEVSNSGAENGLTEWSLMTRTNPSIRLLSRTGHGLPAQSRRDFWIYWDGVPAPADVEARGFDVSTIDLDGTTWTFSVDPLQ